MFSFKCVTSIFDLKTAVHFIKNKIKGNKSSNLCLEMKNMAEIVYIQQLAKSYVYKTELFIFHFVLCSLPR